MKKLFKTDKTDIEGMLELMKKDAPEAFDESGRLNTTTSFYEVNGKMVQIPREVYEFQRDQAKEYNKTSQGHVEIRRQDTTNVFNVIMGMLGYDSHLDYTIREKPGWKATPNKPLPRMRCTHVNDKGHQCEKTAPMGSFVCIRHGAKMKENIEKQKEAIQKARMRITGMTDDALDVIQDIIESEDTNPQVRLKAAQDVLDRAGLKPGIDMNIDVNHHVDVVADLRNTLESMVEAEVIEEADDNTDSSNS
jgi:hypothetical protein